MNTIQQSLNEATYRIEGLYPKYIEIKEEYNNFMKDFEVRKAEITLQESTLGLKNQEMREAEVTRILETEGLLEKKLEISNRYYKVKLELDYSELISSNLRALIYEDKK